jgi:hypothetical protein
LATLSSQVNDLVKDVYNLNAKIALLEGELSITKDVIIAESVALLIAGAYIIAHGVGLVK